MLEEGVSRTDPDRINARETCTHYRDISLTDNSSLFSGNQGMQVLRSGCLKRWNTFLFVCFICLF